MKLNKCVINMIKKVVNERFQMVQCMYKFFLNIDVKYYILCLTVRWRSERKGKKRERKWKENRK